MFYIIYCSKYKREKFKKMFCFCYTFNLNLSKNSNLKKSKKFIKILEITRGGIWNFCYIFLILKMNLLISKLFKIELMEQTVTVVQSSVCNGHFLFNCKQQNLTINKYFYFIVSMSILINKNVFSSIYLYF